jgi:AraC-like DNA-binding protein
MTLALSGPLLRPLLASLGLLEISALEISKPEKLENMMLEIIRTADSREREAKLKLSERAYAILLFISSENRMKKYPSNLIKALELFEKNIHNSLSVDQICFFLGISQPTLSRLFKKYIHISPMAYFIEQKMRTAKMLLRDHSLSIKEIAQAVGYSNQLYFSAEFRKRTGVSPKFFREKRKK